MNFKEIVDKLYNRLEFSNSEDERKYQEEISKVNNKYPDEGWHIPQGYIDEIKAINDNKLRQIRNNLNDDAGFNELYAELNNLKGNKLKKEQELENLIPPNKPNLRQKLYSFFSRNENSADSEMRKFEATTKDLRLEIHELNKTISNLEKLKPIYNESKINGGKKQTHRNKKTKKNQKTKTK